MGIIKWKSSSNIDIGRKYYENNSVDNLRTLNNQKQSYDGRILPGKGEQKGGNIGEGGPGSGPSGNGEDNPFDREPSDDELANIEKDFE